MSCCIESIREQKTKACTKLASNLLQMHKLNHCRKQLLKINGRVAKLAHGETIAIYSSGGSLKADFLFEEKVMEKYISVILVGKFLNFGKTGNLNGTGMGVIFSKEKRILYIGEVRGLRGGSINFSDYEDYNKLVESIKDIEISHVTSDLKSLLSTMVLENSKIIYMSDLNLPKDISETLTDLVKFLNVNFSISKNDLNNLKTQLIEILPEKCYWEFLEMFLEFYFIRRLPVFASRKIIKAFTQGYKAEDILKLFTKYQITDDILSNEIESRETMFCSKYSSLIYEDDDDDDILEWDLITWINQILEKKNKSNNSLFQLLDKNNKFFERKFLSFRDPNTQKTIIADYIEDFKKSAQNIIIKFSGLNSMTIIPSENQIQIESNLYKELALSDSLYNIKPSSNPQHTPINEITISKASQSICPGRYNLIRLKDTNKSKKKFLFIKVVEYILQKFKLENNKNTYIVKIYLLKENSKLMRIKILKNKVVIAEYFSYEEMDKCIRVSLIDKNIICESMSTLIPYIIIDFYEDTNRRKIQQLAIIKDQLEKLRIKLINNEVKRSQILDEYINERLTRLTPEFISRLEDDSFMIGKLLQGLITKYKEELDITKTPEEILLKLALQAQYEMAVSKKDSVDVQQIMELLSESKQYTDEIKGKSIVILLGSTGSGKSTTSCYLMKAKMESLISRFGEEVIEIKNKEEIDNYPKIGQSIGTSETLYARGYKLNISPKNKAPMEMMLCDCPGFRDTRGTEYELCTNLSIDKAIKSAQCIKGAILVIQYTAFLQDRGQPVLESFQNLIDIIPSLLEEKSLLDSVFILITKVGDIKINADTITERIRTHTNEIETLMKNQSVNYDASSVLEYKHRMWSKIQQINAAKHLFIVKIEDRRQRTKILNAIYKSQNINNSKFNSAIVSKELYKKYADFIEIETHSWIKIVFPKFLDQMPKTIFKYQQDLENNNKSIENNYSQIANKKKQIELNISKINQLNEKINKIKGYEQMFKKNLISSDDVQKILESENIKRQEKNPSEFLMNRINDLQQIKKDHQERVMQAENEIIKMRKQIKNSLDDKENFVLKKQDLESGLTTEVLYTLKYDPDETIEGFRSKPGAREQSISEMRELRDDEYAERDCNFGLAKNYIGPLHHTVWLDKSYRIVPKNNQEEFFRYGNETFSEGKSYKAIIEGNDFVIDLTPKASPDGKRMIWPVKTTWVGRADKIPFVKISHSIPNIDFNEATINNIDSQIKNVNKLILEYEHDIKRYEKTKNEQENKLKLAIDSLNKEEEKFKENKRKECVTELTQLLSIKMGELKNIEEYNKGHNNDIIDLEKDINKFREENKIFQEEIVQLKKERKFMALSIYDHLDVLKNLLEFCDSLNYGTLGQVRNESLESAKEYIAVYSQKIEMIKNEVFQELKLVR